MQKKFHPAYLKEEKWFYCVTPLPYEECIWWFFREGIDHKKIQTTVIPNDCKICPTWSRKLYVRYKLRSIFRLVAKEF